MRITLLRHGETAGNAERRYIGRTEEPLSAAGRAQLATLRLDPPDLLFSSPMLRCRQTAEIVFPGMRPCIVPDFRECDFGDFEGKNYLDLTGDPAYQAWIDSGGEAAFPHGEAPAAFRRRCVAAFEAIVQAHPQADLALVVHGGTIMAILEHLYGGGYFSHHVPNGCAVVIEEGRLVRQCSS